MMQPSNLAKIDVPEEQVSLLQAISRFLSEEKKQKTTSKALVEFGLNQGGVTYHRIGKVVYQQK